TTSRSWLALNRSTRSVSPAWVAARHHTRTVPVAEVPKPGAVVSGSGSTELHAGSAVASAPRPARRRKPRREVVIVLSCGPAIQAVGSQTRMGAGPRLAQA